MSHQQYLSLLLQPRGPFLQLCQSAKMLLQGVTKFSTQIQMGVTDTTLTSPTLPFFVHAMVLACGSWPIQVCHLDGPFHLEIIVDLLPQTLRQLVLKPEPATLHMHYPMAIFA